jgi:16S rRNA (guanine966-N2)-methyltransferase
MRITGGEARGRLVPSPEGLEVRPTASKIRQAFFNILSAKVPEADFLDVFSGTGLMGLEALSRGAGSLTAIEEARRMVRSLEDSLKLLGYEGQVIAGDFRKVLATLPPLQFDIIFSDPPYRSPFPTTVLLAVERFELLKEDGVLAIEHARGYRFENENGRLQQYDRREYGQTALSFFRLNEK